MQSETGVERDIRDSISLDSRDLWTDPSPPGLSLRLYFRERARGHGALVSEVMDRLTGFQPKKLRFSRIGARGGVKRYRPEVLRDLIDQAKPFDIQFEGVPSTSCAIVCGLETTIREDRTIFKASDIEQNLCELAALARTLELNNGYLHPTAEANRAWSLKHRRMRHEGAYVRDTLLPARIEEVFWWNAFAREWVERVGRQKFQMAPADRIIELDDGGVLVRSCASADDAISPVGLERRAHLHAYLCDDVNYHFELHRLQRRAAEISRFVARWDEGTEHLLVGIADTLYEEGHRTRFLRRFRDYRAPSPLEVGPLDSLLPGNEADVKAEVRGYHILAETAVRWAKRESHRGRGDRLSRAMEKHDPQSLHYLDIDIWAAQYHKYEAELVEARLASAVGHYLGCLIEEHLGGEWVPRSSRSERQIVAGGRVWFPVQRAWNCMVGPRGNVLRSSLYQYYKAVEAAVRAHNEDRRGCFQST